jgi:hypothetical protein
MNMQPGEEAGHSHRDSWLGLGIRKEDHYKLARIQVDLPNTLDADWQIDVRKARATPPPALRERLLQIAQITRTEASNIYRHRGARLRNSTQELVFLWERRIAHGKTRYQLNRNHPAIKAVIESEKCSPKDVETILRLIEETVPVPTITIDAAENPEQQREPFEGASSEDLLQLGVALANTFKNGGSSPTEAMNRLSAIEPFNRFPDIVQLVFEAPG